MRYAIVMYCVYCSENEGGIKCNQTEMPLQEFSENLHSTSWKMSCMMPQKLFSQQAVGVSKTPKGER